ncbi:phosphoenolpyruvate synthase [Candidatus Nomurabacteria bacterium RIFCSPHIGHO2_02_FULL_41_52]|uniref:Phosphoenolpyruvate synthase n=1 Tax=Candidatus Nomurabacteria bacterium RIFCSPLOWO2_12_FULL_41_10 TaxID=1801795 RepID=A0A1F6YAC8_9BACT|nr:MAG: phosphoenolpyruvate synthase [Candidatus Nomurabacteria bacterium RIFCSPHIGHO2_02_FULL_41_52]OGI84606.1 MAG: phosphoenolpyruvate synthase [Candidatus Nomurabacteria bacterium RIFCSPHIGHO2_12_FULL_42_19]OGI93985.1 MAG: phosphoenolpyruvate synthase [Candidatus Nomurabacteria bacterium RIFCSPLOWO2_01_FULL_41_52]OGI97802.1 MAG: phosphoenolpyruvate synthase [Candidatus Nomurabacteria bacterium RIFCSPLOWO2_02_FULL_42_24]OGJ03297.1 MAG: phosphoenolpyruvate synthase [Candidatus Nomurabacteria b
MAEEKKENFVKWYGEVGIADVPSVGGKNAALGEMYSNLVPLGVRVPDGFALTADAYRHFFKETGLDEKIKEILSDINTKDIHNLQIRGKKVREAILEAVLPQNLQDAVARSYEKLGEKYGKNSDVAVRSSATAEDLPGASFAGQQETYLNVHGIENILIATKKCIASLFTDRAISYRADKGFSHFDAALSVGIQLMVRSDLASSGVAFTIDTETGFDKVILINGIYGLGEFIVQGKIIPDEFIVFKPMLENGVQNPIIGKNIGKKNIKLVYAKDGTKQEKVSLPDQQKFCITDEETVRLAKWCFQIEKYFSKKHGHYQPMDIEWAKDGKTGELFIVQARPETVISGEDKNVLKEYKLQKTSKILASGIAVGAKIGSGKVRVLRNAKNISLFKKGEVLVTEITDPDWEPIMKIAGAIVTDKGGRTSHAAIVSRELGIPCIVGTGVSTKVLKNGQEVTVDASPGQVGNVYEGIIPFEIMEHHLDKIPKIATKIMVNIGSPDEAFKNHYLPAQGVGLGRLEFIIASHIRVHPNALIDYKKLKEGKKTPAIRKLLGEIEKLTPLYEDKTQFYVDELALGIAKIAATFYPNEVIIRFSDFKTNEYRTLLGGILYEPHEENPMLGWRGASRYYDPKFKMAFGLECMAMKKVREDMGFINVVPMIPFCRTPEEGKKVVEIMKEHGLDRANDKSLKIYVMCEIPSNILLADEFLEVFDGMSIGSNDLTQLTLGLDRDSGIVTHIANENNPSVKKFIAEIIHKCREKNKYIGICGQAPSDYPEFAQFLVSEGIESMSLNPDTVIKIIMALSNKEQKG